MLRILVFILPLTLLSLPGNGQPTVLGNYVQEALDGNIALKRTELSYEKSLAALKEAKAMFLPTLNFQSRFSFAQGGRVIELPLGDLVNPVYENLELINDIGSESFPDYPSIPDYPRLENENENFLRTTDQETRLRLSWPVFNAAIIKNHQIRKDMVEAERMSVEVYKQELIMEVKNAYYQHLQANEAQKVFENALELVNENLRTTQSLYRNEQVTVDQVYAAEAQVQAVEQQLAEANEQFKVSEAWFNFLLNRNYDEPIEITRTEDLPVNAMSIEAARTQALGQRTELEQLNTYLDLSEKRVQAEKAAYLPNLNLATDYGIQGTTYSFDRDADYLLGSVVLSWDIFDQKNKHKVQQARIDKEILQQQKMETSNQIGLQVVTAFYDLETALASISFSEKEAESAAKAYRLVNVKYTNNLANLVELTEARTNKTNADHNVVITRYEYLTKLATFERMIGQ